MYKNYKKKLKLNSTKQNYKSSLFYDNNRSITLFVTHNKRIIKLRLRKNYNFKKVNLKY